MTDFRIIGPACTLGEGPLWHPERQQLFWFDIPAGTLHSSNALGGQQCRWNFGEPASACGWVDSQTLIVATASGLQKFDIGTGAWDTLVALEADNQVTRANDGRVGPGGAFWIGTMGNRLEPRAGAYYRYAAGQLTQLFDQVSVPNATCFSPDGRLAYLADTPRHLIWRWPLDDNGAPIGEREVHIDLREERLNPDGAVCDAEGFLWNAQWGASRVVRYRPDGTVDRVVDLPVSQPTCPAFGGADLKTLYVTSASEALTGEGLDREPDAGKIFAFQVDTPGIPEFQAKLNGAS